MDEIQISFVQNSWEDLKKIPDYESLYYDNLFNIDPTLISRLGWDEEKKTHSLVRAFEHAVMEAGALENVQSELNTLGLSFAQKGLTKEDYISFGQALLNLLDTLPPGTCDERCKNAWIEFYTVVGSSMMDAS